MKSEIAVTFGRCPQCGGLVMPWPLSHLGDTPQCIRCRRAVPDAAQPAVEPASVTCPECGEPDPMLHCEGCGHNFNRDD